MKTKNTTTVSLDTSAEAPKHTPGKWRAVWGLINGERWSWVIRKDGSSKTIAIVGLDSHGEAEANAERIVRAVNSHDELLGLVKYAQNHLDLPDEMQVEFLAAIARAEGKAL